MNGSHDEPVHFLQIWLMPERPGLPPSYEEKHFAPDEKQGRCKLIASPGGAEGSLTLQQDARVYASILDKGQEVSHTFARGSSRVGAGCARPRARRRQGARHR